MVTIQCKKCGKDIKTFPSRLGRKKYCSHSCRAKDNLNKSFLPGHSWVGKLKTNGVWKRKDGYVSIFSPTHPRRDVRNTVLEHRLVMEKSIGRLLEDTEVVHHKNGIRNDNRIENLELFSSHSEHIKTAHL